MLRFDSLTYTFVGAIVAGGIGGFLGWSLLFDFMVGSFGGGIGQWVYKHGKGNLSGHLPFFVGGRVFWVLYFICGGLGAISSFVAPIPFRG